MTNKNIFHVIKETTGLNDELILIITGSFILYYHLLDSSDSLIKNIFIGAFVLAIFDMFLKNIILFHINDDYYKFIANNVITIIIINFLILFVKQNYNEMSYLYFFNLALACFFYETIVFKLYNYNNLCNSKVRSSTKIIFRLATIHILSNFLNDKEYNKEWFDFSISQLFNFLIFDTLFNENFFEDNN